MTRRDLMERLAGTGYVAGEPLAMALHLALRLGRPLLLEGEAGVGKTALAAALAEIEGARLIRLQCYEGLDAASAIYEWNYQRQLLAIRATEASGEESAEALEERLFSERYLLRRPLLEAILQDEPPVLLIDEIDRADAEFEAYLLEVLGDFQVSVPELGTIRARARPRVILTSNGTRELSDALRRRCLYAWVEYPDRETELAILARRAPGVERGLAEQAVAFVHALRREPLEKTPGIAETLDWVAALSGLGINDLSEDPAALHATLACLLKTRADRESVAPEVASRLVGRAA
jgi:MoxR-like ATPase